MKYEYCDYEDRFLEQAWTFKSIKKLELIKDVGILWTFVHVKGQVTSF